MAWGPASNLCQSLGGHLATITSRRESHIAKRAIEKSGWDTAWIGYTDQKEEGTWNWVTREKSQYSDWAEGQPNNAQGKSHWAHILTDNGWNDAIDRPYPILCEWEEEELRNSVSPERSALPSSYTQLCLRWHPVPFAKRKKFAEYLSGKPFKGHGWVKKVQGDEAWIRLFDPNRGPSHVLVKCINDLKGFREGQEVRFLGEIQTVKHRHHFKVDQCPLIVLTAPETSDRKLAVNGDDDLLLGSTRFDVRTAGSRSLTRMLNDPSSWNVDTGQWDHKRGVFKGSGDSSLVFQPPLPPNFELSFKMAVKKGMRPRVHFSNALWIGNEGYDRDICLYPDGKRQEGKGFPYKKGQKLHIRVLLQGANVRLWVNGKPVARAKRNRVFTESLRIQGGDGWSKGTTLYSSFRLRAFPHPTITGRKADTNQERKTRTPLSENKRKDIYKTLLRAEDRAIKKAKTKYPLDPTQALKVGDRFQLTKKTPLMAELEADDPMASLERMRQIAPGAYIKVAKVARKDHTRWYKVKVTETHKNVVDHGWINSLALRGQAKADSKKRLMMQTEMEDKLTKKYEAQIAGRYGITQKRLEEIAIEGLKKGWHTSASE